MSNIKTHKFHFCQHKLKRSQSIQLNFFSNFKLLGFYFTKKNKNFKSFCWIFNHLQQISQNLSFIEKGPSGLKISQNLRKLILKMDL